MTTITTAVPAFRQLVLAFVILASGFAAVLAAPAQDAGASSIEPYCQAQVGLGRSSYNGRVTVYGAGKGTCEWVEDPNDWEHPGPSGYMQVYLYKNGVLIDKHGFSTDSATIQGRTHSNYCTRGARYTTVVTFTDGLGWRSQPVSRSAIVC